MNRGKAVMSNERKGQDTKAIVQREVMHLEKEVAKKKQESTKKFQEIKKLQKDAEECALTVQQIKEEMAQVQNHWDQQQRLLNEMHLDKMKLFEEKERQKRLYAKYDDVKKGKFKLPNNSKDLDAQFQAQVEKSIRVKQVIQQLQGEYPQFSVELNTVLKTLDL